MGGTLNKATIIGALGKDPEIRSFPSGGQVANFSVATSESWKDKSSGEKKERVQWHNVQVFNEHLIKVCENYLRKGSKVYIEGQIETRKYTKDDRDVFVTEIVLRPYSGVITILSSAKEDKPKAETATVNDDMNSEIPF